MYFSDTLTRQRPKLAPHRDALIDLAHFWQLQVVPKLELTNEHHLQQLLAILEVRQNANLFEQRRRHILRFVDNQDRKRFERLKRFQKVIERIAEVRA